MSGLNEKDVEKVKQLMDDVKIPSVKNLDFRHFMLNPYMSEQIDKKRKELKIFYCTSNLKLELKDIVLNKTYNLVIERNPNARSGRSQPCRYLQDFIYSNRQEIDFDAKSIINKCYAANITDEEKIWELFMIKFYAKWEKKYLMLLKYQPIDNCQLDCRKGLIGNSGINKYLKNFEDNIILCDANNHTYVSYDNRKIKWIIRNLPLLENIAGRDEFVIIDDILNEFKYDTGISVEKLNSIPYSRNLQMMKRELLSAICQLYFQNQSADNIEHSQGCKLDEPRLFVQSNVPIVFGWEYTKNSRFKGKIKNISYYQKVLKILFILSNGQKEFIDNIAKLIAICILGKNGCEKLKLKMSQSFIILTNNKRFVREFLISIFKIGHISSGGFKPKDYFRFVNKEVSYDKLKVSELWGISEDTVANLSNPKMTGKFLEDKLNSVVINITSEVDKFNDKEYFRNLVTGKKVNYNNEYLGKQELISDKQYIFIVSNDEEIKKLEINDLNIYKLSYNIPPDIFYDERDFECNDFEKRFIVTDFAEYGLKLLFESSSNSENCYNHTEKITNPVTYFIENCCNVVKIDKNLEDESSVNEKIQPNEINSTAMITLGVAYNLFYDIVDPQYKFQKAFDQAFVGQYGFQYKIIPNTRSKAKERDLKNGYTGDKEVVKDKGAYCIGLVVKPKDEIPNIAKQCKSDFEKNTSKFTEEEFIQFIADIGDLHFDEDEYSELIKSSRSI